MNENEIIEQPIAQEPVVEQTPVETVEPIIEPVAAPEFVYEYQPTDEHGRNLGAKQVFKGKDANEVMGKIADANKNLIKMSREMKRKLSLGITETEEEIPETVTRIGQKTAFAPRELTSDERYQISRDLLDPEKYEEASNLMFASKFGAKPSDILDRVNQVQEKHDQLLAKIEADAFVSSTPGYYGCTENFMTLTSWMSKKNLDPTRSNFKYAFNKLMEVGLLLEAPTVREETSVQPTHAPVVTDVTLENAQPVESTPSRITSEEIPSKRAMPIISSGLNNKSASSSVGIVPKSGYTLAEINRMPSGDFLKKCKSEPGFEALVEKLEAEHAAKRAKGVK